MSIVKGEFNQHSGGWGLAGQVETTALVTEALIRSGSDPKLINRSLTFLLKHKDRYGVWHSTQATINVLDAMLALSSQHSVTQSNSAVESAADVAIDGRVVHTLQLPAANRVANPLTVDISRFVRPGKNKIEITRRGGSGPYASVHALVNFYVPWSKSTAANKAKSQMNEGGDLRLRARFDKTESNINDEITCHVKAERIGSNSYGMMLAEIGLPPGASVDRGSLETALTSSGWAISQYDVLPDRVVFYLWPQAGRVEFSFRFRPRFGLKAKTAPSILYDYYNPEARDTVPPVTFTVR